jgi:hypothetical protein
MNNFTASQQYLFSLIYMFIGIDIHNLARTRTRPPPPTPPSSAAAKSCPEILRAVLPHLEEELGKKVVLLLLPLQTNCFLYYIPTDNGKLRLSAQTAGRTKIDHAHIEATMKASMAKKTRRRISFQLQRNL